MYYLEVVSWPLSSIAPNGAANDKMGPSTETQTAVTPLLKSAIQEHGL